MRVGADVDGVISPAVRGRSIGRLVDQHRTMIQSDWQRRFADASRRRQHAGREIELLEAALTRCADEAERMELANHLGVPLAASGVSPASDERDYAANLAYHAERLRQVADMLEAGGVRLALEFIGPLHYRANKKFEFAYSMDRLMELIRRVGSDKLSLTLDIWHLYTSGGTNADLTAITANDVGIVHVNDAPEGIARDDHYDLKRELPLATGVLEIVPFMQSLQTMGFDGPVMPEPFSAPLEELAAVDPLAAAQRTADSLNDLWKLAKL